MNNKFLNSLSFSILVCLFVLMPVGVMAAEMNDYCVQPPFIASTVPPLVMFEVGRDHKLFYQAYNDAADLDDDGILDITYKHSIDYYGYFDPYKCYEYSTTGTDEFIPVARTTTKFCSSAGGQWSGNILNWMTMSRIDVLKKVLYGGHRSTDSTSETVLERSFLPQDAHSWGKEFTGRLCYNSAGTPQYTYMCSIDSDCATGYTCTDKSKELVGFDQAGMTTCTASTPGTTSNKMLVVRYRHPADITTDQQTGDTHTDLLASFASATEPLTTTFIDYDTSVTNFGTSGSKIDPTQNHLDSYSAMVVAEFKTSSGNGTETWQFMMDSDDGGELEIFTTSGTSLGVVASHYGAHSYCSTAPTTTCSDMVHGSITLAKSNTWYRLVVRYAEQGGQDGVRVWYKNPSKTNWTLFGTTNLGNNNMRTFNISSSNQCTLQTSEFINQGQPTSGAVSKDSSQFHMVCNTTTSATGAPLMRLLKNVAGHRIWDWAAKERPECDDSLGTPTDYEVRVRVCDPTIDTADQLDIKKNEIGDSCKWYPATGSGIWKPVGLLEQYGEGDGSQVCSKNMSKPCNSNAGCDFATEGECVYKADMYFGMFTTSYTKNTSGGVLRKNISSILDESNSNNGIFQTSENEQGNIIMTMDRLQPIGYRYSDYSYQDPDGGTCGWITDRPMAEGECRSWGNPIAEMMYESLRYFAGKLTPTADFTYSTSQDSTLNLSKPDWGYKDGSTAHPLYDVYPSCAKPFVLLLSDINTSYDSDQIPGSSFTKPDGTTFTEDSPTVLKLADTQPSGRSLLNDLANTIGATEGITGNSWYIGENGTIKDFICSGKTANSFSLLRGICPAEPTKMGSYYSAALAYYGKTKFKGLTDKPEINTFVVALSSPFSELQFKTSTGTVSFLPTAKSVSGCLNVNQACAQRMDLTLSDPFGLQLLPKSPADPAAFCPTNQIVNYFVDDIRYDSSGNVIYALYRINYEDVEQGADHDMDAIAKYEICTSTAATDGYGSCGSSSLTDGQIEVKLVSDYAAGCIDQVMGFVISGTTEDGVYLPIKDADVGGSADSDTPAVVANLPLTWSKQFTVSSTSATSTLKNPLWYAAKWGGFNDKNGNNVPDQKSEWANDCTNSDVSQCNPDNYYQVVNPLKLRRQLNKALTDIMKRVSSGTAASILNNSEGSGANLLQAVFYPIKSFDGNTEAHWIGEMQNLWYYLDPSLQNTSIREDSNQNNVLNLKSDLVTQFYFDPTENQTLVQRFADNNGDGLADDPTSPVDTVSPDDVRSLWKAGRMLWERNLTTDPRTIYTGYNSTLGSTPQKFSNLPVDGYFNTWPNVWNALQIPAGTDAQRTALATKLISYVHGNDQTDDTAPCLNSDCKYRPRKVTISGCNTGIYADHVPDGNCTREWKLGDIISSTPKLVSNVALNQYNLAPPRGYNDVSYKNFTLTSTYQNRGMVFVGGNDGMLHAFRLGVLKELSSRFDKAQMNNASGTLATTADKLGREEWAYIPKYAIPYLRYLTDSNYSHLYYVDRTPTVFDASIGKPAGCSSDYSDCTKVYDGSTWRTVIIGGMGIGGASSDTGSSCSTDTDCVKNPLAGNGYSSYFALDVTDPANPKMLWEFSGDPAGMGTLGYSTTGPAIIRISKKDANGNPDHNKNGKWFAVFASGPTGPIDTALHQFKGQSNQNLRLFIVDIGTGELVKTIDTGIANAFAGSLASSWIDTDRYNQTLPGYYSDDALYVGYVQKDTTVTPNTWTKGGVLRVLTRESDDPASTSLTKQWDVHPLISNIGPVTTSVTKLQDRANHNLWIYFGTGRFFFRGDDNSINTTQKVYGIKEPCYSTYNRTMMTPIAGGTNNDFDQTCTDAATAITTTSCTGSSTALCDQSGVASAPVATLPATMGGWFISLDAANSSSLSERIITDPVASTAGAVFFTSFKPSAEICKFGGDTQIWATNYASGGAPPSKAMEGKALIQVSTGAFKELSLKTAFDWQKPGGKTSAEIQRYDMRRTVVPITGVPPTSQGLSLITNPPPVKKFLHVIEK